MSERTKVTGKVVMHQPKTMWQKLLCRIGLHKTVEVDAEKYEDDTNWVKS